MKGFKAFLLRGNVVELAVAVVIAVAFGLVITAFVKDLVTPLIAALFGKPDFGALIFTINNSKFLYGDFINAVVSFLIVAAVIYFFVVVPYTAALARARKEPPADPTTKRCPECESEIPIGARRCAFCTSPQPVG
jgi:large conductance mechanosensitive channel